MLHHVLKYLRYAYPIEYGFDHRITVTARET
jgi:hypothetical protein